MRPPVFLTGATGFVGGELARQLARRGHRLHALAREQADRSGLAGLDITWHVGDLVDGAAVAKALDAACADGARPWVAHVAAVISYRTRDADLQRRVNVEGTRSLLEACRRRPVGRVLHMSSVVTVADSRDGAIGDEETPFNGARLGVDYVDTKRAAEELALAASAELDLVVVNPGAIFGPNPRGGNTVKFLRKLAQGRIGPAAPPGSLSLVGVEDVAAGSILALERGTRGRRYLLVESSASSLEVFRLGARLLGVRGPRWRMPDLLWEALIAGARVLDRLRPTELFTPQTLRMLGVHYLLSGARARAELGWRPRPFEAVLADTIADLRARNALD